MTNETPVFDSGRRRRRPDSVNAALDVRRRAHPRIVAARHFDLAQGARAQSARHGDSRRCRRRRANLDARARPPRTWPPWAGMPGFWPGSDFGRLIAKVESWGCGYTNLNWMQASPCRSANLPQIRLKPILKARAEELNPGAIRFHHELIGLDQDGAGVNARIKNHDTGDEYTGEGALSPRLRWRSYSASIGRHRLRRPGCAVSDGDCACLGRPVQVRAGPGRAHPLDLVSRYRRSGGARAHGARPVRYRERGVGFPRQLSRGRSRRVSPTSRSKRTCAWRWASGTCR